MTVIDASAMVEWLLGLDGSDDVGELIASGVALHAPHLIGVEVASVLRRYVLTGDITAERGEAAFDDFMAADIARFDHEALFPLIWGLRDSVTAYDGAYVALAMALEQPLVTVDQRLARAVGNRIDVVVPGG